MSDKLNDMLRKWAEERQPSDRHLGKLADKIRLEASRQRHALSYENTASVSFWQKLSFAGVGAATALVSVLGFLYFTSPQQSVSIDKGACGMMSVSDEDRQSSARLFCEMEKVFPERLTWIAESNGDVGLGVESLAGGFADDKEPILVRLSVVKKGAGDKDWTQVWDADVMLRGEEVVEVVPNKNMDNKLALWVFPLSDGKIAIDSEVALNMPFPLHSRESMVVKQGETKAIMSLSENGVQYRLMQTVTSLGEPCKGSEI